MQRHDDRDALLLGHAPQDGEQLQLVADVQKGGGLVQDDDLRLLTDGPGQQDALALAVADGVEVPVGELQRVHRLHGGIDLGLVLGGQDAQSARVGVAAGGHDVPAGH